MSSLALLFDLDGTLIDSAPDLVGAANEMRECRGMPRMHPSTLRPMVGSGARGMLGAAFGIGPGEPGFDELRDEFLRRYEARMLTETRSFEGIDRVLDALDASGTPWGIVTNKITRFADPICRALGFEQRTSALVCGDTTQFPKPHPAPLLEAALRLGARPADCIYVGDDLRDIVAGRAAGMRTAAASWGYLGSGPPVQSWGADLMLNVPADILKLLESA